MNHHYYFLHQLDSNSFSSSIAKSSSKEKKQALAFFYNKHLDFSSNISTKMIFHSDKQRHIVLMKKIGQFHLKTLK